MSTKTSVSKLLLRLSSVRTRQLGMVVDRCVRELDDMDRTAPTGCPWMRRRQDQLSLLLDEQERRSHVL